MNLVERQRLFLEAAQEHFGISTKVRPREMFGVSNSAKIVEGGIQLGVVNLEGVKEDSEALILGCVLRFPPEDEVYFAVLVKKDRASLVTRLTEMKRLGAALKASKAVAAVPAPEFALESPDDMSAASELPGGAMKYRDRNNNVSVYLAKDGRLWLRNAQFWDSLNIDLSSCGPSTEPDKIAVALYPPTASARRSLLAREFIGWLGALVGQQKIHELSVWRDVATLGPDMRRKPSSIPVADIEAAVSALGGHYPHGEVRRFHAALNFLNHKHFVILSGISGTGKTQLALKYARAVHGITTAGAADPLIFECPVRPEWTDPTGLTGYYDVLTNRYVVPPFLEAVLVATAHRESPVFVILDEMNLARVEYYLSDVLSAMESGASLQLHSNDVPLEGTTGASIRAEIPLPNNLFVIGTINVDETTNPVSDKVLDRASVIEMSSVDLPGFLDSLQTRFPELEPACTVARQRLIPVHNLMRKFGLGFGYRLIEEFIRYHAFDAAHLKSDADTVTDQLLMQKVFVKLRGGERQRPLLEGLLKACDGLLSAQAFIQRLQADLDEYGSFQAMR